MAYVRRDGNIHLNIYINVHIYIFHVRAMRRIVLSTLIDRAIIVRRCA